MSRNLIDLVGQRFGKLEVLERAPSDKWKATRWLCKCDCGTICEKDGVSLRHGDVRSCGCNKKEFLKQVPHAPFKDETGNIYGSLKVLERVGSDKKGHALWLCECVCGQKTTVTGDNLRGGTSSCGCQRASRGEIKIFNLLSKYGINFKYEFTGFKVDGLNTRFDFYVEDNYLIEYDGETHYINSAGGWWGKDAFDEGQRKDQLKNQWCKDNNITLIRIPYTRYKNLCIEDLLNVEKNPFIFIDAHSYLDYKELKEIDSSNIKQLPQKHYILSDNILQYSIDGNFIKKWDSMESILKELQIERKENILHACKGNIKTSYGFQWRWENDNREVLNLSKYEKHKKHYFYIAYDKDTKSELFKISKNKLKDKIPNCNLSLIDSVCERQESNAYGYIWRYGFDCDDM